LGDYLAKHRREKKGKSRTTAKPKGRNEENQPSEGGGGGPRRQ